MEAHAQSGWLCELVVGSDDARVRECEFVELLVDTGATEHVCGPHGFTHAALNNGPRPELKTVTGELLKHYGTRTVDFRCQGEELRVGFTVVDVKRPRRFDGATVALTRRGGLFVLQCQTVVPMLLALVDEEPVGEAPDLPPIDEEMERELMGREEVEPPVAIEVPAPDEPTIDERRHHGHTFAVSSVVQRLRQSSRERKQTCVTVTKPARHTRHSMRLLLLEDRRRCSNGHSSGVHRHSVQTNGCHSS